jgi:hypothetical protein
MSLSCSLRHHCTVSDCCVTVLPLKNYFLLVLLFLVSLFLPNYLLLSVNHCYLFVVNFCFILVNQMGDHTYVEARTVSFYFYIFIALFFALILFCMYFAPMSLLFSGFGQLYIYVIKYRSLNHFYKPRLLF